MWFISIQGTSVMSKFIFSTPFSGEIAYHPIILPTSSKGSPQLDRDLLSPKSLSGESCSTKSNSSSNWSPSGRRMSHETLSSSGGDSGFFNVPTPPGTFLISSVKAVNCLCNSPEFFFCKAPTTLDHIFVKPILFFMLPFSCLSRYWVGRRMKEKTNAYSEAKFFRTSIFFWQICL